MNPTNVKPPPGGVHGEKRRHRQPPESFAGAETPEHALCVAVLLQAWRDAQGLHGGKGCAEQDKAAAHAWFLSEEPPTSFPLVCAVLGLSMSAVRRAVQRVLGRTEKRP